MKWHQLVFTLFVMLCSFGGLFAQGKTYEGPDDPAGDIAAEREGYMTGNRVFLYFRNTTELSDWPRPDVSRWPNDANGTKMLNGVAFMVGARVYVEHDSIPVTDPAVIGSRTDLDTLYFLQTSYREEMDRDPTGTIEWGFYPVFGYFNALYDKPAMSNDPRSWPPNGWPSRGDELICPGEWNGRFGRGVQYADLETYFVVNDAHDQEYLGAEDKVKYYPRPGVRIGDKHPEYCTIQRGKPWGGLGVRVEVRGFQWNNQEVRDIIFWEYKIANISDYDLPEIAVGFWFDNDIGGDAAYDELGYFDTQIDMAYSWDVDGKGNGGLPTGTLGFALLETPALPFDQRDNDDDGLVDERRDNVATRVIGPLDGIADLDKFLTYYNLEAESLRDHWDADEDQDWDDGNDANANGIYDPGEEAGDDVGLDGVGPADNNYTGPDEGECNHRPDFLEGYGCEPDFAAVDVSESDMMGLTAFRLFRMPSHASEYHWFRSDRSMWELIGQDSLAGYSGNITNLILTCASGPLTLHKGSEERVSVAIVHAYDALTGLNSNSHAAPNLFQLKHAAQKIYENDYRFEVLPPQLVASFYADIVSGVPPLTVHFFDQSYVIRPDSGTEVISWLWNFGDGATSQSQNPEHTYAEPGEYDVTLIVRTQNGLIDTLRQENLVLVSPLSFAYQGQYDLTEASLVNGSAWADWDNDGDIDLSIADRYRTFLFLNNSGGSFTEVTEGEIVARSPSYSQSWGDFDNDGDLDLLNAVRNLLLFKNGNDGSFTKIIMNTEVGWRSSSVVWVDYNNDGWLDIFATRELGKSLLYKNNGDGTFAEVTDDPLASDDSSTCAGWADYDNDNDLDLFTTKLGANCLYRNEGNGLFTKIVQGEIVTDVFSSNTCSWADYDNDGDLDVFVGNVEADVLYRNNGDGTFARRTDTGIDVEGLTARSSSWGDFNNDGHADLLVVGYGSNAVYKNNADGTFERVALPRLTDASCSTGSWGDFNFDGKLDLYVGSRTVPGGLYINFDEAKHWIEIKCIGTISNKSAIGAKVRVKSRISGKDFWQMQEISAQTGARSQNSLDVEFGSGNATLVDSLVIRWPSGAIDSYSNIAADQIIRATENEGWVTRVVGEPQGSSLPARFALLQNYPNPFNPTTQIRYQLSKTANVTMAIFNVLGQKVRSLVSNESQAAGYHGVEWDGRNDTGATLPSGVYFCRLIVKSSAGKELLQQIRKIVLVR